MPRWYARFIEREYKRLFQSAWCPRHGRIPDRPALLKKVAPGIVEVECPKCRPPGSTT